MFFNPARNVEIPKTRDHKGNDGAENLYKGTGIEENFEDIKMENILEPEHILQPSLDGFSYEQG